MRDTCYHEDDYCQIELVAEANGPWCADQMRRINEFAARHKAESGWTDVYVRSDHPTPLSTLAISGSQFTESMPASMRPFDRVFTGYGAHRAESGRTIAFGPHESLVAYAALDEQAVVCSVWLTLDLASSADVAIATELAQALARWPVCLADWGWSRSLHLTDTAAATQYFSDRLRVFGRS